MLEAVTKKLTGLHTQSVASAVIARHLTYLDATALRELGGVVRDAEARHLPGVLIETGCALGGSAIVMAAAKCKERVLQIYDTFAMIPPPSERDGADVHERYKVISQGRSEGIGGELYYGYHRNLQEEVARNFSEQGYPIARHSIQLVRGLFQNTLQGREPVAVAHIDCDWYDSVYTALSRLAPRVVTGGTIVLDDYAAWSGCREATDNYFADKRDRFELRMKSRLHVIRH